jgi:hypothetical protein
MGGVGSRPPAREVRSPIKAAAARWFGEIRRALHDPDNLRFPIAGLEMPCYLLEDGIRVISRCAFFNSIGMPPTGGVRGSERLARSVLEFTRNGLDCDDLALRVVSPVVLRPRAGGNVIRAYEMKTLAAICDVFQRARQHGLIDRHQAPIADRCERLIRDLRQMGLLAAPPEVAARSPRRGQPAGGKVARGLRVTPRGASRSRAPAA